jgi:DNA polymerase-3 subunit delta
MAANPVVYLFYGDDEPAMREAIAALQKKLGDATIAEMNTTRLDAGFSFDALRSACQATPFLATRRLVVAAGSSKVFAAKDIRTRFTEFLDQVPDSTALVLLESLDTADKKYWDKNWLVLWGQPSTDRVFAKMFALPDGGQMAGWILARAKSYGGEFQPPAAAALAQMLGSDKNAAEQEIQKLLAYAGYQRAVTAADVAAVSLPSGEQGDFFGLVDALSAGNGARAMQALEALLPERDLILLYFSLVGHFRGLLLCREMLNDKMTEDEIAKMLAKDPFKMHPYRAQKLTAQARRFTIESLHATYKRLLHYDEQIKTGQMQPELAMESFIAELSVQAA